MSSKRKALGRGLGALIPGGVSEEGAATEPTNVVGIERVHPNPEQPRKYFDEDDLASLSDSIREHGVIQPLLVQPDRDGYRILAGERRWRASQLAGLTEVPIVVREVSKKDALAIALVENLQRVDLNPMEEAEGYHRLHEEFALTQDQIAQSVGKDRSTVANFMRLLRLSDKVQQLVRDGSISMGHARVLVTMEDPARQLEFARLVVAEGLSVRQLESMARRAVEGAPPPKPPAKGSVDPNLRALVDRLSKQFGTKVQFAGNAGRGKIVLEYYSPEEFDRLIEQLLS